MRKNSEVEINVASDFTTQIVECISSAVGDEIKEDIYSHRLSTQNSTPFRIWDLLNTKLCGAFQSPDCMAAPTKRGPWEMVVVYDKRSGNLFTFMREKRYAELHKSVGKRKAPHYVDALVRILNAELLAPVGQMSFFQDNPNLADDETLSSIVQKVLHNLQIDSELVRHHVLVLFESSHFQLESVRAIMVDSRLNIVAEQDWSSSIAFEESTIMEQAESNTPANNPTRGLVLKPKATERKKQLHIRKDDIEENRKA